MKRPCSTLARDIIYYGNCDITDIIASLSRTSDGALMAKVFVAKAETL